MIEAYSGLKWSEVEPVDTDKVFWRLRALDRRERADVSTRQVSSCLRNGRVPLRAPRRMSCTLDSRGVRPPVGNSPRGVESRNGISESHAFMGSSFGSGRDRSARKNDDTTQAAGVCQAGGPRLHQWRGGSGRTVESPAVGTNTSISGGTTSSGRLNLTSYNQISPALDRIRSAGGVVGVGRPQYHSRYLGHDVANDFSSSQEEMVDSNYSVTSLENLRSYAVSQDMFIRSPLTSKVEDSYSAHFHQRRLENSPNGAPLVEGLRMSNDESLPHASNKRNNQTDQPSSRSVDFEKSFDHQLVFHTPVLVDRVVEIFAHLRQVTIVDCTLGGAGHAKALLESNPSIFLIGLDKDLDAIRESSRVLESYKGRFQLINSGFEFLDQITLPELPYPLGGFLFDLGVSSHQLDTASRGFSIRFDARLDMRMDRSQDFSAYEVVNTYPYDKLRKLFIDNGEIQYASKFAKSIVEGRPIETTGELSGLVSSLIPKRLQRGRVHPATRVFQAIRTEVNHELENLAGALESARRNLSSGGRIAVITYQSGEDRIVKHFCDEISKGKCSCPAGLPCVCDPSPIGASIIRKFIRPMDSEVLANPRASSAKLRAVEIFSKTDN